MRAGMEVFRAFDRDARDLARLSQTKLPVPVIGGEKSLGRYPIEQVKLAAEQVDGEAVDNAGHWLMEEAPRHVIEKLERFPNLFLKCRANSHLLTESGTIPSKGDFL